MHIKFNKICKGLVIIKHNWNNNTDTWECSVIEASDSVCDCLLMTEAINPLSTVIIWGIFEVQSWNYLEAELQLWGVKNKNVDLKYTDALKFTSKL